MDDVIICSKCHAKNAAGSVFCGECGNKLTVEPQKSAPVCAFADGVDDTIEEETPIIDFSDVAKEEKLVTAFEDVAKEEKPVTAFDDVAKEEEKPVTAFGEVTKEEEKSITAFGATTNEVEPPVINADSVAMEKEAMTAFIDLKEEKRSADVTSEIYESNDPMAKITADWDMLPPSMPIRRRRSL